MFEQCITNGTAPIIPWKPLPGRTVTDRPDDQTIDRHGIPRCKHCGAPTEFVQWSPNHGKPRLWVRCTDRTLDACERTQTRSFKDSWRLLRPLWRTEPLYHELRASHEHFEAAHDRIRDRYNVAADNLSNRPKVCSMAFHQLRALAACLLEWLRICHLQGWLGARSRRRRRTDSYRPYKTRGTGAALGLGRIRARAGLLDAYGENAERLGIGHGTPPSARRRATPPPASGPPAGAPPAGAPPGS